MRALVVGLGSAGRRHLANLRALEPDADITVWRQCSRDRPPHADRVVYNLADALTEDPVIAVVAGPASSHIETGLALARHGIHLFIEKPLSHSTEGVEALLELCQDRSLIHMVGYNFRLYTPLQLMRRAVTEGRVGRVLSIRAEAGQYLPDWRPDMPYQKSVSAQADLGGGALLELSHELDSVRWLVSDEVAAVTAQVGRLSDLEIEVEDTADVLLRFRKGVLGSVHLDMVQRSPQRVCRIVGTDGVLTWDGGTHRVELFTAATGRWSDLHPAKDVDRNAMYLDEMRHFVECVRDARMPAVTVVDGLRVVEIALAAKRSAREGRTVEL